MLRIAEILSVMMRLDHPVLQVIHGEDLEAFVKEWTYYWVSKIKGEVDKVFAGEMDRNGGNGCKYRKHIWELQEPGKVF